MQLFLVSLCLTYIIVLYFLTNPLHHTRKFMVRRFVNWFPLGMTYAFLYMGRYNLVVAKGALGDLMTKEDFGFISGVGFTVYAVALFFIGPLVDKIGGKNGILLGAIGSSLMNALMAGVLYLFLHGTLKVNLVLAFSILYGLNMLFQSFGAVSTIKVKSFWFHVRERGTFGAIFGTLISLGVYFAFDWGGAIADAVKIDQPATPTKVRELLNYMFALDGRTIPALWLIFVIPALIMVVWALIDLVLLRDSPDTAGFTDFKTDDASSDEVHDKKYRYFEVMKKIFTNKIIMTIGVIELTSGILRNGILQWYQIFAKETGLGVPNITSNWGFWGCVTGIAGGFAAGVISDKLFHSRRAPSAGLMQAIMLVCTAVMIACLTLQPLNAAAAPGDSALLAWFLEYRSMVLGICAVTMMMAVIGVHSIMSGTATADFGGKKAAATATGIADACAYVGSAIQSFVIGILATKSWSYWPMFLLPFTIVGLIFAIKMWDVLPAATRRYLAEVEKKHVGEKRVRHRA
ncbi:MAG: MFS transporter [Planctomycetes bacterium]|nr:MFS transporter [Planctomycetota bacterium]